MTTIGGTHDGDLVVDESVLITGTVLGNIDVQSAGRLELNGSANSNVTVARDAKAIVRGTVLGTLTNAGGDVDIWGTVERLKDLDPNRRTTVHPGAVVRNRG